MSQIQRSESAITRKTHVWAWSLGSLVFAMGFLGSWIPSIWSDELATISASTRSLSELWNLVTGPFDAVHGIYYLLMKLWFMLVGLHDWSIRMPSALVVGLAAAGMVYLGNRLRNLGLGILAAIVLGVIPQVMWSATEARSYAATIALAVWLSLIFLWACHRGRGRWIIFAGLAAFAVSLFIYLALFVGALFISLLLHPTWRKSWKPFIASAVVAAAAAAPIAVVSFRQRSQVAWLPPITSDTLAEVAFRQWFDGPPYFGILAWCAIVAILVVSLFPAMRHKSRDILLLALPWLVFPTLVLVAFTWFAFPLYVGRYVAFSAPAVALLVGFAIQAIQIRWLQVVGVALLVATSLPAYLSQRLPASKGTDWKMISELIDENAQPGDGIWFESEPLGIYPYERSLLIAYPERVNTLVDIGLDESYRSRENFFDSLVPLNEALARSPQIDRLWIVNPRPLDPTVADWLTLSDAGYEIENKIEGPATDLYLLKKVEDNSDAR
jgi:mannosyltransferase